jgi:hypothetical protein
MERLLPKRILWPYGPLRVAFSILAVLSAVGLYFASPRFAESPSLFTTAALILFVAEVSAFEVGLRHLSLSGTFQRHGAKAALRMSEELEKLRHQVAELAWLIEKSGREAEVRSKELNCQVQLVGGLGQPIHELLASTMRQHEQLHGQIASIQDQMSTQLRSAAQSHEQLSSQVSVLTKEVFELKRAVRSQLLERDLPPEPHLLLGPDEAPLIEKEGQFFLNIDGSMQTPAERRLQRINEAERNLQRLHEGILERVRERVRERLTRPGLIERKITDLLAQGFSPDDVATRLGLSTSAVERRLASIAEGLFRERTSHQHLWVVEALPEVYPQRSTGLSSPTETTKDATQNLDKPKG